MKNSDNIEQLFKETFERFEANVNPKVWNNVQHGIQSAPAGGAASAGAKIAIGKIIAAAASVAVIAGSAWYFMSSDNKINPASSDKKNQTEVSSKDISQNNSSEKQSLTAVSNTNSSNKKSIASVNPPVSNQTSTNQDQSAVISDGVNNETTTDASDDNSASTDQHKYGNAPQGPTPINRVPQAQTSQPKPQNSNSSSSDQEAEQVPVANIFASVESGDVPLSVTFSNQGTASSLTWDFGDGTASAENSPTHIFDKPGNYEVKLVAKNSNGSASAPGKITIEVKSISEIMYAPNVFSPNGDRVNDEFFFVLKNIASVDVVISDMHGMLINKWNALDGSWNGKTSGGEDALEGTYIYSIQATGIDGVFHSKKGTVTLSRSPQ